MWALSPRLVARHETLDILSTTLAPVALHSTVFTQHLLIHFLAVQEYITLCLQLRRSRLQLTWAFRRCEVTSFVCHLKDVSLTDSQICGTASYAAACHSGFRHIKSLAISTYILIAAVFQIFSTSPEVVEGVHEYGLRCGQLPQTSIGSYFVLELATPTWRTGADSPCSSTTVSRGILSCQPPIAADCG